MRTNKYSQVIFTFIVFLAFMPLAQAKEATGGIGPPPGVIGNSAPMMASPVAADPVINLGPTISVLSYGAKDISLDPTFDNYQAFHNALAAIPSTGGTLLIPAGTYRIGRATGRGLNNGAVELINTSNITIRGEAGAQGQLLSTITMDNLNPATGSGDVDTANGVFITGHSNHIALRDLKIVWKNQPATRSQGYGIRLLGAAPLDPLGPSNIFLSNLTIESTPQAGVIIMGAQNITARNLFIANTMADGLHFNASKFISVDGLTGYNNGDDTLAFVNYYSPNNWGTGPFNSPDLTSNNDQGARAQHILSFGGPEPDSRWDTGVRRL